MRDRVEHRIVAPVHGMVARHGHNVEAACRVDIGKGRLDAAVPVAGMQLHGPEFGIHALGLPEPDIGGAQHGGCQFSELRHRLMHRTDVTTTENHHLLVSHFFLPVVFVETFSSEPRHAAVTRTSLPDTANL